MSQLVKDLAKRVARVNTFTLCRSGGRTIGAYSQVAMPPDLRRCRSAASRAPVTTIVLPPYQVVLGPGCAYAGLSPRLVSRDSWPRRWLQPTWSIEGSSSRSRQRCQGRCPRSVNKDATPLAQSTLSFRLTLIQWHPALSNEHCSFKHQTEYGTTFSRTLRVRVMQVSARA